MEVGGTQGGCYLRKGGGYQNIVRGIRGARIV